MSSDVCGQAFVKKKKKKKSWIKSEKSKIHSMTFPLKRILENVFS